jgi:hypothetical protein
MWLLEGSTAHVVLLQNILRSVPNVRELFREEVRIRLLCQEQSLENLEALTDQFMADYLPPWPKRFTVKQRQLCGLQRQRASVYDDNNVNLIEDGWTNMF